MILFFLLLLSVSAEAVVVDRVNCHLTLKDLVSQQKTQMGSSFQMARFPSIRNGISFTSAELDSRLRSGYGEYTYGISFSLNSEHALMGSGAQHRICVAMDLDICKLGVCQGEQLQCSPSNDPYDSSAGWTSVEVNNGIPSFNSFLLPNALYGKIPFGGKEVAEYLLSCSYVGSEL